MLGASLAIMGCVAETPDAAMLTATPAPPTPHPTPTQSFLPIAPTRQVDAPPAVEALGAVAESPQVTDGQPAVEELVAPTLVVQTTSAPSPAIPEPSVVAYIVRPGDTLIGIALEFGVPMAAIQLRNDLGAETTIWVDQELTIPQGGIWADASPFWSVYEVVAGDTLSEVAARFDVELAALLTANGLSDGDLIAVGQPLVLPVTVSVEALTAAPPTPEPVSPPAEASETVATAGEVQPPEGAQAGGANEAPEAAASAAIEAPAASPASGPPPDTSALADEIFRRINGERAAYGLPALAWNTVLAGAAQRHADDCYARGWCGHTGSDGSTYRERIIRAGYDPVRWSECWAWYATPEMAVAMWMDEVPPNDPHRRTILNDALTEVGVGVVPGNGHGYYFIADFGTPGN